MAKITEYHRQVTAQKMASVAFWQKHPMSRTECLNQFKRLREQRLALALVCWLCVPLVMWGQGVALKGRVFDLQKSPVAYASVALMNEAGDSLCAGTISDAAGHFSFSGISAGRYGLSVSFVGYKNFRTLVTLQQDCQIDCLLEEEAIGLNEVVVEADRSTTVRQSAAGQTFMLSATSMKKKDVLQALQEIPALTIDQGTRKISLSNGGTPLILINGIRREGGLSSVSPEDILSVEVVQTASAEFMREGYTSVVNIKVKKKERKYVSFSGGVNSHPAVRFGIADASLEVGNNHSSFYVMAQSFAFLNNKSDMLERTTTEKMIRELSYSRNSHYNDTYVAVGGDRLWNERKYSSFSVTFNYIPQSSSAIGESALSDRIGNAPVLYDHMRRWKDRSYIGSVNLYHKHQFADASVLDVLLQCHMSRNVNQVRQMEKNGNSEQEYHYDFHNDRRAFSLRPSYRFRMSDFKMKIGLDTDFQLNDINRRDGTDVVFSHREWSEYLYWDANRVWGSFSLTASLGLDMVYRKVEGRKNFYCNVRPVVNLGYRLNARHSLGLNVSLQSVSPDIVQLNPYNTSSDTLTVSSGNPYLTPYHIGKLRLAYTFTGGGFYVEPTVEYRRIDDAIVAVGEEQEGHYVLTSSLFCAIT